LMAIFLSYYLQLFIAQIYVFRFIFPNYFMPILLIVNNLYSF